MEFLKCVMVLSALLVISLACSFSRTDPDLSDVWRNFKEVHHKKYRNNCDAVKRRRIFERAVFRITKHNLEFDLGQHMYRIGLNKYSDLAHQEFVAKLNGFRVTLGSRRNKPTRRRRSDFQIQLSKEGYPRKLDYRDQNLVTPVRDQGECGSCWAFSAVASLESQIRKMTNRSILLSEQNLLDCSSNYGNKGCRGGVVTQAFNYIINNGINAENTYPYRARVGMCKFDKSNIAATCSDYDEVITGKEEDLLEALIRVGPISVGIDASRPSFQDYKGGIYYDRSCSSRNLNHAVLAIGYGTENGMDYWLIKNSYGTSWGENGYMRIARNKNNLCGLATQASYPIV